MIHQNADRTSEISDDPGHHSGTRVLLSTNMDGKPSRGSENLVVRDEISNHRETVQVCDQMVSRK